MRWHPKTELNDESVTINVQLSIWQHDNTNLNQNLDLLPSYLLIIHKLYSGKLVISKREG